jgi:hypothetical protein
MCQYTGKTAAIALVAATAKTLLELTAGAADRVKLKEWWCEFDGITASAVPVLVQVLRKTGTITGSGSPPSPVPKDAADGTAAGTLKHNATGEGTDGVVLYSHNVPPTLGKHVMFPLGDEIVVPVSGIIAIKVTAPAVVNAIVGFGWDE